MKRTIMFKNGKSLQITQQIADILYDRISGDNCRNFQCFRIDNVGCVSIINISEIVYIS